MWKVEKSERWIVTDTEGQSRNAFIGCLGVPTQFLSAALAQAAADDLNNQKEGY